MLEQFSLKGGRPLRALVKLPNAQGVDISNPHALPGGPVWLTISTGPRCEGPSGGGASAGPCFPAPGSCTSKVVRFDPATGRVATVLRFPGSELVTDAVPSPDGRRLALVQSGCATSYFDAHLVVRDLRSSRQWSIGADARRCHALSEPAWSTDGSRLAFAYGPSTLGPHERMQADRCAPPRRSRLVVVAAGHGSKAGSWKLTLPPHGRRSIVSGPSMASSST